MIKSFWLIELFVLLSCIIFPGEVSAATSYHVAKNCTGINNCFTSIQPAVDAMSGGDTVYIHNGTYAEGVRFFYKTNTTGLYMTLTNYNGEQVIIDGTNVAYDPSYQEGLIYIKRTDYVRISGLTVQHANMAGIYSVYANNIIVENNHTYDTVKSGISTWITTNAVIDGNDIALACNSHPNYPASEENISISAGSANIEVKNNYVHQAANIPDGYSGGEGINIKDGSHDVKIHNNIVRLDQRLDGKPSNRLAYGLDAWATETYNISFYNNIAFNNASGFIVESEAGGTARDISVYNNVAYNNSGPGFYMPNWAQNETSLKKNILFANNTAYNNGTGIYINSAAIQNITVKNNIISQNGIPVQIGSGVPLAQIISDHNFTSGDPVFVNPAIADFHLQNGSGAIDAGTDIGVTTDFDGTARPQGLGFDIGAFEYKDSQKTQINLLRQLLGIFTDIFALNSLIANYPNNFYGPNRTALPWL